MLLAAPLRKTQLRIIAPCYNKKLQGYPRADHRYITHHNNTTHFVYLDGGVRRRGEILGGEAIGSKSGVVEQRESEQ